MKLLLVNDDGVFAEGIKVMAQSLKKEHELLIVAPFEEQSGLSQSITYRTHLDVTRETIEGLEDIPTYAVHGTPADCTKYAMYLTKHRIDAVISGINRGWNIGTDICYSGTFGAAMEGAINHCPSLAVSVSYRSEKDAFTYAAEYTRAFLKTLDWKGIPEDIVLNINFPETPKEQNKGTRLTVQGLSKYDGNYVVLEEKEDVFYRYRLTGWLLPDEDETTDIWAVQNGYVSITPML